MSTTFEVYTPVMDIPSFKEILEHSNMRLKEFLLNAGIKANRQIQLEIRKCITHEIVTFSYDAQARWADDRYAWFTVSNEVGGCDAYCYLIEQIDKDIWEAEFKSNPRAANMKDKIKCCLKSGFYWSFRRSAGQPSIINLSYGLIAAAFAELTNGFIYSDDNAWDYNMFPAEAGKFLADYFRPDYHEIEHGTWARECLKDLRENLK